MQVKRKQKFTMKTKLQILIAVFSILFSIALASAQQQPRIDPATGLPLPPQPQIDPATGLPADGSPPFKGPDGTPTWIDPAWPDPGKVLPRIDYQGLPLSEVANQLRQRFTNAFDIILPNGPEGGDPTQINVDLQLQNVTATEIFNAMNLQFELDKSPFRWELTWNGNRPTAVIRDLPQLGPSTPPQTRKVFYVGDLLGVFPGTNDDQRLDRIADTIAHAGDATGIQYGKIDIYSPGQLLIVSGTPDQVDLAEQTLRALKDKAAFFEKTHQSPQNPK